MFHVLRRIVCRCRGQPKLGLILKGRPVKVRQQRKPSPGLLTQTAWIRMHVVFFVVIGLVQFANKPSALAKLGIALVTAPIVGWLLPLALSGKLRSYRMRHARRRLRRMFRPYDGDGVA